MSNDDIYNNFCYSECINCSLHRLVVDHLYQLIDNNKDGIVAVALLIGRYRQSVDKVY